MSEQVKIKIFINDIPVIIHPETHMDVVDGLDSALSTIISSIGDKEDKFNKNTAFNKNFGPNSENVVEGVNGIYYVSGNVSGDPGIWTGAISGLSSYYEGLTIIYKTGVVGTTETTLNINDLGIKSCKLGDGTDIKEEIEINKTLILVYDGTVFRAFDFHTKSKKGSSAFVKNEAPDEEDLEVSDIWLHI